MTNSQPHEPGSGTAYTPPPNSEGSGFFDQLRGSGVRRSQDRWIAGVCGGVARRLNVDPLLVRAATIALFVFGIGFLAYLIAWALLPDEHGTILAERAIRDGDAWGVTLLVFIGIGVFFTGPWMGNEGRGVGGLFFLLALGLGVWWLVSRSRSDSGPPAGPSPSPAAPPPTTAGGPTAPAATSGPQPVWSTPTTASVGSDFPHEQASAYAGAGSAYPPTSESGTTKTRSAGIAGLLLVIGAAIIGGGIGMALADQIPGPVSLSGLLGATAAAGLATLLLGLLGRRSALSGMLSLLLALSLVSTWGAVKVPFISTDAGTKQWVPTASTVESTYSWNAGNATLDLRNLDGPPRTEEIRASLNFGELILLIPEDLTVRVLASAQFGSVEVNGTGSANVSESRDGLNTSAEYLFGSDELADVDLTVRASVNFGEVRIITPVDPSRR